MNDLISRSAQIEKFTAEAKKIAAKDKDFAQALMYVVTCLDAAPAVDAVPVVRCAECEYYENEECVNPYIFTSDGAHLYTKPQDFCSYGERRDDGT